MLLTQPISLAFMIAAGLILLMMVLPAIRQRKEVAYESGGG